MSQYVDYAFALLNRQAGLTASPEVAAPGCTTSGTRSPWTPCSDWYRGGVDVKASLPLLSTFLGHTNPASTYWYYSDSRVIPMPAPSCA